MKTMIHLPTKILQKFVISAGLRSILIGKIWKRKNIRFGLRINLIFSFYPGHFVSKCKKISLTLYDRHYLLKKSLTAFSVQYSIFFKQ